MSSISSKKKAQSSASFPRALERFGLQIALKRKEAGYTYEAFARKIDIHPNTLTAIEFGYATQDEVCAHLEKLASGLELPVALLTRFLTFLQEDALDSHDKVPQPQSKFGR